jgi:hypothetical protein
VRPDTVGTRQLRVNSDRVARRPINRISSGALRVALRVDSSIWPPVKQLASAPRLRRRWRRWSGAPARSRGQAAIEFGLAALMLVLLISGGIDLSLMVTTRQNVSVATGEAARQAAYGAKAGDVVAEARRAATGSLARPSGLAVAVRYCQDPACTSSTTFCDGFLGADSVKPNPCPDASTDTGSGVAGLPVTVTLWEEQYEVLTPWIRAWAVTQSDLCTRADQPCYLRLTSSETVNYPGPPA